MSRCKRGFTLIELMTVLVIILILASMVFPAFTYAINASRRSACMTNLKELAQAVELYRQEGGDYPPAPNFIGAQGVPQGGMTGMTLLNNKLTAASLWCPDDQYPVYLPGGLAPTKVLAQNGLLKDTTASSYNFGYNYYGYVTSLDNTPFPITTRTAFAYLMADPHKLDADIPPQQWDLGLVKQISTTDPNDNLNTSMQFAGLSQCLANTWAPANTIVSFCPNHMPSTDYNLLPVVMLSGETTMVRTNTKLSSIDIFTNANNRGPNQVLIDWRLDKALLATASSYNNSAVGDAPNATITRRMPVVEVTHRILSANTLANGAIWYDTGVRLQPHDLVMVLAHAKWALAVNTLTNPMFAGAGYQSLADAYGNLWFSADGDPVEAQQLPTNYPPGTLLYLPKQSNTQTSHCQLVGLVASSPVTPGSLSDHIFSLGSRGSHLVTMQDGAGNLQLAINDTLTNNVYTNAHVGFCECWVAVCHPTP